MDKKIEEIEILRGFAILAVVAIHITKTNFISSGAINYISVVKTIANSFSVGDNYAESR